MNLTNWLARRVSFIACTIFGALLTAGTVAGFTAGYICLQYAPPSFGATAVSIEAICRTLLRFGVTSVLTGVAAVMFLAFSRGWPRPRQSPDPIAAIEQQLPDWFRALGVILTGLPFATFLVATPGLAFVRRNFELLSDPAGGILLMAPLMEIVTVAALLTGDMAVLLLFLARTRNFPRACILMTIVHLGLLLTNVNALELTRLISESVDPQLSIVQEHQAAVEAGVRNLTWLFVAHVVPAIGTLFSATVQTMFAKASTQSYAPAVAGPTATSRSEAGGTQVNWASRATPAPVQGGSAEAGPFQSMRYFVRATYLAWPFGGSLKIDDLERSQCFGVKIVPLQLKKTIHIYSDELSQAEILTIQARQVISTGCWYDIVDTPTREHVASVQKGFGPNWRIHDQQDQPLGALTEKHASIGVGEYVANVGQHAVALFRWTNAVRPALEIDFSTDSRVPFDRRLGVALGLLLFINLSFG